MDLPQGPSHSLSQFFDTLQTAVIHYRNFYPKPPGTSFTIAICKPTTHSGRPNNPTGAHIYPHTPGARPLPCAGP